MVCAKSDAAACTRSPLFSHWARACLARDKSGPGRGAATHATPTVTSPSTKPGTRRYLRSAGPSACPRPMASVPCRRSRTRGVVSPCFVTSRTKRFSGVTSSSGATSACRKRSGVRRPPMSERLGPSLEPRSRMRWQSKQLFDSIRALPREASPAGTSACVARCAISAAPPATAYAAATATSCR